MDAHVTVISGAASGIGEATARACIGAGGRVVGVDRTGDALDALDAELGPGFRGVVADVSSTTEVDAAIASVEAHEGRIDAVVTSAGHVQSGASQDIEDDVFHEIQDVHLHGTLRLARAAHPLLAVRGGAIVTIGSVAARVGLPRRAAYGSAKAGIEGLTRTLAVEWASAGIRVNCVHPGYVNTAFTKEQSRLGNIDTTTVVERTPLHRLAEPEEIAAAILFFASPAASYITGQSLMVDGGLTVSGDFF